MEDATTTYIRQKLCVDFRIILGAKSTNTLLLK